jgi:hypothetical protein
LVASHGLVCVTKLKLVELNTRLRNKLRGWEVVPQKRPKASYVAVTKVSWRASILGIVFGLSAEGGMRCKLRQQRPPGWALGAL